MTSFGNAELARSSGCAVFGRRRHLREVVAVQVLDAEHAEDVVDDRRRELDVRVALDEPLRLEAGERELLDVRLERHAVLQADRHAIAKQFISERKAAPSLCMSMKISPSVPSSYSPVRRKILCPPTLASCVKPRRFFGRRTRVPVGRACGGDGDVRRCVAPAAMRLGRRGCSPRCAGLASVLVRLLARGRERLRRLAAVAVERDRLEAEPPALLVDLARPRRPWPRSAG